MKFNILLCIYQMTEEWTTALTVNKELTGSVDEKAVKPGQAEKQKRQRPWRNHALGPLQPIWRTPNT